MQTGVHAPPTHVSPAAQQTPAQQMLAQQWPPQSVASTHATHPPPWQTPPVHAFFSGAFWSEGTPPLHTATRHSSVATGTSVSSGSVPGTPPSHEGVRQSPCESAGGTQPPAPPPLLVLVVLLAALLVLLLAAPPAPPSDASR